MRRADLAASADRMMAVSQHQANTGFSIAVKYTNHDYHYKFAKYVPLISQRGIGQSGISESRLPRFEPDHLFSDYQYDYVLEKCCTYNCLKLVTWDLQCQRYTCIIDVYLLNLIIYD